MTNVKPPKILITRATGQVGSKTIKFLTEIGDVEIIAAVRSPEKAALFTSKGITTVILDLDNEGTHLPALEGIDRLLSSPATPSICCAKARPC
jgi:NAD(P)H dehydrogenase (quinone)